MKKKLIWIVTYFNMNHLDHSCPICYLNYGEQEDGSFLCKDGIDNSDYESPCKHYICVTCCRKMCKVASEAKDEVRCPLCREDWTQWIFNNRDYDEDEEESWCIVTIRHL